MNMTAQTIGRLFLEFHEQLGYQRIQGSPLLDDSVPMSFVMSAGMVQFEKLSNRERLHDRFCLIQNCFRYFDLEQIGTSKEHLSLFQMPGAFDFGPIDRRSTIARIWKLLVDVYGFRADQLVITYFGGGVVDGENLPADSATASAWHEIGLPWERIFGLPAENNFWIQTSQAVGPRNSRKRGPNTEVFFDRGNIHGCGTNCAPGCSCGRYIEFLNTLFISHQFNEKNRSLTALKEPFTEVVIGLERVAQIIQGQESVFEIDNIFPLILQLRTFSKPIPLKDLDPRKFEKIFTDHIRALLFLTADGAPPPGKGGRARLMRILVRELLTSQRLLGISDTGFIRSIVISVLERYPQLEHGKSRLLKYLGSESERFDHTIQSGMRDLATVLRRRNTLLSDEEIRAFEKEHGIPMPLLRYQLWQKVAGSD